MWLVCRPPRTVKERRLCGPLLGRRVHQPGEFEDALTARLRAGARDLLAQAIEAEVEGFRSGYADQRLKDGRERLVRHGFGPERIIQTGIGPDPVRRAKFSIVARRMPVKAAQIASAFPRRCCRNGPAARRAWTPLSRPFVSAAFQAAISKWRSRRCLAKTRQTFPRLSWRA